MSPARLRRGLFEVPRPRLCNVGEATPVTEERALSSLPAGLVDEDEVIILLLRPSLLYVLLSSLTSLAVIAIITLLLAYMANLPWVGWGDTHAFALGAGLMALRVGWQALEWYSRIYVLTDRRIIRRMGVLRIAVFQTPLKNIQHTSVFRRVRERLFGLGTIGFATAGSDVYEAFWVMVNQPFAVHKVVNDAIRRYR
ncbi:MAG: PH domain-containing protein [Planctomycetota bacterium]|jgi:membrane protein YdbS with pleckstrin-like domain